jgi:signal peptidase II
MHSIPPQISSTRDFPSAIERAFIILLFLSFVIYSDQYTKSIAVKYLSTFPAISCCSDTFTLTYIENSNGFLGITSTYPWYLKFFLLNICIPLVLLYCLYYLFFKKHLSLLHLPILTIITAGGLSNLLDRLIHNGKVIDFMQLHIGPFASGIFNLADIYILGGSFLLGFILLKK